MPLPPQVKASIEKSVLCWLATVSADGIPNVSPKEIFTYYETDKIIIANIASPQTVKNIKQQNKVCVSFIDILVQKGFQVKGTAEILGRKDSEFEIIKPILTKLTGEKFPFASVTKINVEQVKPIIAPGYMMYPDTTEEEQIESAKRMYGI